MKRPFFLTIPATIVAGAVLFGLSDTAISIADTSVPDNEVASNEANNAPATARITITMTGALNE